MAINSVCFKKRYERKTSGFDIADPQSLQESKQDTIFWYFA